jgi:predicted ATPase/class 3 adenylate cyclase
VGALPTGTVTFLFTDIEASTRLWERHPEAMGAALARHDALTAALLEQHRGILVKQRGEGDSLFAVFHRAADGVAAATALQRALCAEPWPAATPLRVRIALHTGDAVVRDGDYFGTTVNRCARLRAVAHGGQILLSAATRELAGPELPPEVSLRDLGTHRLRDLQQPEHVFQLLHPELPAEFPPLRSLEAFSHNLPVHLTSFIGREQEMAEAQRLLTNTRLLTLTGSGGCGKTRLALQVAAEVAEQFADGVWLVELAALADAALVPQSVATALGVREEPGRSLTTTLTEYLRPRSLLLVLDNCEHLLAACAQLADALLRACPKLRIVTSSREGLGIVGEQTYRVPSLAVPDPRDASPVERLLEVEAIQLFSDRARLSQPSFAVTEANVPAVVEVCHRLDGIPLAIELAAARVKALPVEQLATRLDDRFRLLTGGSRTALPRQQTLRALIDWSYDLLSGEERTMLRRLSVFAGGCTLAAAEAVGAGEAIEEWAVLDLLTGLVEKSLVLYEEQQGEGRYRLLETVRQYARDRLLESGEGEAARDRHLQFSVKLAEEAEPWLRKAEQPQWLDLLETEHDNLRVALEWSQGEGWEAGLRLAADLMWFWFYRNHWREGRRQLEGVLTHPEAISSRSTYARALSRLCLLLYALGDYEALRPRLDESIALARELDDTWHLVFLLFVVGLEASPRGDTEKATAAWLEGLALARKLGDPWLLAQALVGQGLRALYAGEYDEAATTLEEAARLAKEAGDRWLIALTLANLASVLVTRGEYEQAGPVLAESITLFLKSGERGVLAACLEITAGVYAARQQPERAARLLGAAEVRREATGYPVEASERFLYERHVAAARSQLSAEAFASAWAEGRAMAFDDAIALALEES